MRSPPSELQGSPQSHEVRCEACDWNAFAVSEYTAEKIQRVHTRAERRECDELPEVIELDG